MLVHAKTPPIDVQISGTGAEFLIETLKKSIKGLKISAEDETIPINSDPWFQALRESRTSGEVFWCYRDNAGLTLDELAEKSGIAKSHLSEMENNKRPVGLKTAKKLAEALNCLFRGNLPPIPADACHLTGMKTNLPMWQVWVKGRRCFSQGTAFEFDLFAV